jgi:hypothetical protein
MPLVDPSGFTPALPPSYPTSAALAASSGSSLVGFLPSGTGAVATDLQTQARKTVFLSNYATQGNYDTAKVALSKTEKMAFGGALEFMSNASSTLRTVWRVPNINTSHGDFAFQVNSGALEAFNSDTSWAFGYNPNHEKAGVPSLFFSFESDWDNGSGPGVEWHLAAHSPAGVASRPFSMRIEDGSRYTDLSVAMSSIGFFDQTNVNQAMIWTTTPTTAALVLNKGTTVTIYEENDGAGNTTYTLFQRTSNAFRILNQKTGSGTANGGLIFTTEGTGAIIFGNGSGNQWFMNPSLKAWTDNANDIGASGANRPRNIFVAGNVTIGDAAALVKSSVAMNNGAGAGAGTILNAPAAGNPTKWIPINDNGTTRYVPAW